jgi:hypothetical protein
MMLSHWWAGLYSIGNLPCENSRIELEMSTTADRATSPDLRRLCFRNRQIKPATKGKRTAIAIKLLAKIFSSFLNNVYFRHKGTRR